MSKPIQDFKNSSYERPNQTWIEVPIESADTDGAQLTLKRRSIRSQRRITTAAITAFTIGALLIAFNSKKRNELFVPGPLASNHAQILNELGTDRCAACHAAGNKSFTEWVSTAFTGHKGDSKCQSDLCMECHKNNISEQYALTPHNVAPEELKSIQQQFQSVSFRDSAILSGSNNHSRELACNACHREHHGETNLSKLTDQQCQSCHTESYHSFETDHPEFTSWPISRRSRIAFDHSSHALKHYAGQKTKFECSQCHIDDASQNVKVLAPYEETCAHCHDQKIREGGEAGLAVFALPMLDLEAISAAGLEVGDWPESATGEFDGGVPPAMKLLLMADENAATAFNTFGSNFDFSDVDPEDKQQVGFAVDLVWSIKYLLYDLSVEGQKAIKERLATVLQRDVSAAEVSQLAIGLTEPIFQEASRRWLPRLNVEVAKRRWGRTAMKIGWVPGEILMRYEARQDELLAPNPLNGLIKPLAEVPAGTRGPDPTNAETVEVDTYPVDLKSEPPVTPPRAEVTANGSEVKQPALSSTSKQTTVNPRAQVAPSKLELKSPDQLASDDPRVLAANPLRGSSAPQQSAVTDVPTMQAAPSQPGQTNRQQTGTSTTPNPTTQQPASPPSQRLLVRREIPKNLPIPTAEQLRSSEPDILSKNPMHKLFGPDFGPGVAQERPQTEQAQVALDQPTTPVVPDQSPAKDSSNNPVASNESPQQEILDPAPSVVPKPGEVALNSLGNTPEVQRPSVESEPLKILRGVVPVVATGAWIRDDQMLQVSYRSGGHADSLLKTWLELLAATPNSNIRPETSELFTQLTSTHGIGTCKSCHTVDQLADDTFNVNWKPEYRDVSLREFTRFSHGPHVMQPVLNDCSHCHNLDPEKSNKDSFASLDPREAISNFHPIVKDNCTSCHREGATDNGCTQCHNYHVGSKVIGTRQK